MWYLSFCFVSYVSAQCIAMLMPFRSVWGHKKNLYTCHQHGYVNKLPAVLNQFCFNQVYLPCISPASVLIKTMPRTHPIAGQ